MPWTRYPRFSASRQPTTVSDDDFHRRVYSPHRVNGLKAKSKHDRDAAKANIPYIVRAQQTRRATAQTQHVYGMVFDFDTLTEGEVRHAIASTGLSGILFPSPSHWAGTNSWKVRFVAAPYSRPVSPDEHRALYDRIAPEGADPCMRKPAQGVYEPACPKDAEWWVEEIEGAPVVDVESYGQLVVPIVEVPRQEPTGTDVEALRGLWDGIQLGESGRVEGQTGFASLLSLSKAARSTGQSLATAERLVPEAAIAPLRRAWELTVDSSPIVESSGFEVIECADLKEARAVLAKVVSANTKVAIRAPMGVGKTHIAGMYWSDDSIAIVPQRRLVADLVRRFEAGSYTNYSNGDNGLVTTVHSAHKYDPSRPRDFCFIDEAPSVFRGAVSQIVDDPDAVSGTLSTFIREAKRTLVASADLDSRHLRWIRTYCGDFAAYDIRVKALERNIVRVEPQTVREELLDRVMRHTKGDPPIVFVACTPLELEAQAKVCGAARPDLDIRILHSKKRDVFGGDLVCANHVIAEGVDITCDISTLIVYHDYRAVSARTIAQSIGRFRARVGGEVLYASPRWKIGGRKVADWVKDIDDNAMEVERILEISQDRPDLLPETVALRAINDVEIAGHWNSPWLEPVADAHGWQMRTDFRETEGDQEDFHAAKKARREWRAQQVLHARALTHAEAFSLASTYKIASESDQYALERYQIASYFGAIDADLASKGLSYVAKVKSFVRARWPQLAAADDVDSNHLRTVTLRAKKARDAWIDAGGGETFGEGPLPGFVSASPETKKAIRAALRNGGVNVDSKGKISVPPLAHLRESAEVRVRTHEARKGRGRRVISYELAKAAIKEHGSPKAAAKELCLPVVSLQRALKNRPKSRP